MTAPKTTTKTAKKASSKKAAPKKAPAKAAEAKPAPDPLEGQLFVVKGGRVVYWPLPGNPFRAGTGGIIRGDDPFVNVKGYGNQRYKMRPVTELELEAGRIEITYDHSQRGRVTDVFPIRLTGCNSRKMHKEYRERGCDWMPLELEEYKEVSPIVTIEEDEKRVLDLETGEDFEVPQVDANDIAAMNEFTGSSDDPNDPPTPDVD